MTYMQKLVATIRALNSLAPAHPPAKRPECQSRTRSRKEGQWKTRIEMLNHPIFQRLTRRQQGEVGIGVSNKIRRKAFDKAVTV